MIRSRRCPRAMPPCAHAPEPSGPRGTRASAIRSTRRDVGGAVERQLPGDPAHGSGPQRPHVGGRRLDAGGGRRAHERGEERRVRRVVDERLGVPLHAHREVLGIGLDASITPSGDQATACSPVPTRRPPGGGRS